MDRDKTNEMHAPTPKTKPSRSSYESEHPYTEHDNYQDVTAQPLNNNNSSFGSNKTKTNVRHYEEFHAFSESYCSFVQNLPFLNGDTQSTEKFSYVVLQKRSLVSDSLQKSSENTSASASTDNSKQTDVDWQDINIVELLAQSLKLSSIPKHKQKQKNSNSYNNQNIMSRRKKEYRQLLASQTLQAKAEAIQEEFLDSNEDDLGLELVSGRNTHHWGRLVRAPLKKKKHVILDYCTSCANSCGGGGGQEEGRIIRHTIGKASHGEAAGPGMYHAARRARWGGLWPDVVK